VVAASIWATCSSRNTGFHPTSNDPATDNTVVSQKPDLNEAAGAADAFACTVPAVDSMI
jgi:hypothetical protein